MSYSRIEFTSNGVTFGDDIRHIDFGSHLVPNVATPGLLKFDLDTTRVLSDEGGTITGSLTLLNGNLILTGTATVDGRKPSVDGAILDAINTGTGIGIRTSANTYVRRQLLGTTSQITVANGDGSAGDLTLSFPDLVRFPGTNGVLIPRGTTLQRPASADIGLVRGNLDTGRLEVNYADGWHNFILDNDARIFEPHVLTVSTTTGAQFNSVKAAMDSITDSSSSNRYVIDVHPGLYMEDTITFKSYVTIRGACNEQTAIMTNTQSENLIVAAANSAITGCYLSTATSSTVPAATGTAIIYANVTDTTGVANFLVDDCQFGVADYLIRNVVSDTASTFTIYVNSVLFGGPARFNTGFSVTGPGTSRINIRNSTSNNGVIAPPLDLFVIDGTKSTIVCTGGAFRTSVVGGNGLRQRNGGTSRFLGVSLFGFGKGIWIENNGAAPLLSATGCNIQNGSQDLVIDHPATTGQFSGSAARSKSTVSSTAPVSISFLDPEATGQTIVGPLYIGSNYNSTVNVTDLIDQGSPMGIVSGGVISAAGGLNVTISGGYGYVDDGGEAGPGTLTRFDWPTTTVTLPANQATYPYITLTGQIAFSTTPPEPLQAAIFGRVVTDTTVAYIENVPTQARHPSNYINRMLRQALGSVWQTGSTVMVNNSRTISVSSGTFWYGGTRFQPVGGNPISFRDYYHSNATSWTYAPNTSVLDTTYYDGGTGLVPMPNGTYTKHTLYMVGDGVNEQYMLVRGQQTWATLLQAENGLYPTPPNTFGNSFATIAAFIVQANASTVTETLDLRPTLSSKPITLQGASIHGNLFGLDSDDHKQYLLTTGSRAMAGALAMGGNPISNVGTINGVTITSLASRLIPNGPDALPTAAPTVALGPAVAASTGTATSFSRSDHTHSISGVQPISAELSAIANLASTGITVRTGTATYAQRSLTTSTDLTVSNGDGVAANPLIGLANTAVVPGTWNTVTVDAKGRVVAASNATYLSQNQTITLSGDVTGSGSTAITATLANSGVTAGSYGPHGMTVDAKGRVTSATNYSLTDLTLSANNLSLSPIANLTAGSYTLASVTVDSKGRVQAISTGSISLTGDATGSGGPNVPVTLASVNAAPGTYTLASVTVDAKGRVTSATSGSAQAPSVELSGISNLSTLGLVVRTGTGAYTTRSVAVSSDLTIANADGTAGTLTLALSNTTVTASAYGSASQVPTFTVDSHGRLTAASNTAIAIPSSAVTDATSVNTASTIVKRDASGNFSAGTITATLAGNASTASKLANAVSIAHSGDATGSATFDGSAGITIPLTLATVNSNVGTFNTVTVNAKGLITAASNTAYLTGNQPITVSGDASGSGTTAIALTLANTGVVAGTFNTLTVNAKGLITAAANTAYLTANQTITATGDVTGSGTTSLPLTLATVNSNVGTFNTLTVNAKGLVTAASNTAYLTTNQTITISGDVAGSGSTAITLTLPNVNTNVGTFNTLTVNAKGQVTAASNTAYLTGNQPISITGDATGSGSTAIALTLANSGVTAGTWNTVTVDAKGRVTAGANTAYLTQNQTITATGDVTGSGTTSLPLTLASVNSNVGTWNTVTVDAKGRVTAAANTAYLTQNQSITVSGDATGSGTNAIVLTLANSGVTAGSYGSTTAVPVLTVDAKGRVTAASAAAIAFPVTSVAGKTGAVTLVSADITDATASNTASTIVKRDASGNFTAGTITATLAGNASTATKLATARTITYTGDVTGSESFDGSADLSTPMTLAASGVTAGTYTYASITVDSKGRITSAANGPSVQRLFYAEQLDDPSQSDWAVAVVAPATSDATYPSITMRAFDDTAEEGIGFLLSVPSGVTNMTLRFTGRPATAPTSATGAVLKLYRRTISVGAAPTAWANTVLTTFTMTSGSAYYQSFNQTLTLSSLGLTAGTLAQFEVTRQGSATADTLTGDFNLVQLIVEFS